MFKRVFRAFQYRDFRLMWLGACTSSIGTWMQIVAQSWLVYQISNSKLYLGIDQFLAQIPIFLFSLIGGVYADRHSRRTILLGSQFIQMACSFALMLLAATKTIEIWHIWCLSFVVGLAQAFGGPAYQALVPSLVDRQNLQNAIALNSIQFNLARVIGPVLGGLALVKLNAAWCFGLNGLSFVAVIISLLLIRAPLVAQQERESVMLSMKKGIQFIRAKEGMNGLIALAFLSTMLSYPLISFLPVFARDVLRGGPNTYTVLLVMSGVGSVVGALSVAASQKTVNQAKTALMAMMLLGVVIVGFALSRYEALSGLLLFVGGLALMVVFALNSSLVQLYVSDAMRGRVMSVYNLAFRGGMPMGSLLSGTIMETAGAPIVMAANGVLVSILAVYFLFVDRKVSRL